jgi:hypothetical protein
VIVVGGRGELEFGSLQGDQSQWFMDERQFVQLWDSSKSVIALAREDALPDLQRMARTAPRVLGRQGKTLLVANH